jgi:hypothetical protein
MLGVIVGDNTQAKPNLPQLPPISHALRERNPIRMGKAWIGQATWVSRLIWREPSVIYRSSVRKPVPGDAQLR